MKRLLCFLMVLLIVFLFGIPVSAADESVNIVINGKAVAFTNDSGRPYIDENGRTMVPLRFIAGAEPARL